MVRRQLPWLAVGLVWLLSCAVVPAVGQPRPVVDTTLPLARFDIPLSIATSSGTISVTWKIGDEQDGDHGYLFELQQSQDENFGTVMILYRGPDLASFISGLPNGTFYYRVRAMTPDSTRVGDWSEPARVEVTHHSLNLALTLAGLGSLVFLATVGVIVAGSRRADGE